MISEEKEHMLSLDNGIKSIVHWNGSFYDTVDFLCHFILLEFRF